MTNYQKHDRAHTYARRNGFKDGYESYLRLQWDAYRAICKRCDTKAMTFEAWKSAE